MNNELRRIFYTLISECKNNLRDNYLKDSMETLTIDSAVTINQNNQLYERQHRRLNYLIEDFEALLKEE